MKDFPTPDLVGLRSDVFDPVRRIQRVFAVSCPQKRSNIGNQDSSREMRLGFATSQFAVAKSDMATTTIAIGQCVEF